MKLSRPTDDATVVRDVIVVSDTHLGCQFGLCPPHGFRVDSGGHYMPNKAQETTWRWWEQFCAWAPEVTCGRPFSVVMNGDALDGVHHNSNHQWSHNLADQQAAAEEVLGPLAQAARDSGGKYYHIRGTEAHVGPSGQHEEQLAKALGAVPNEAGQYARFELYLRVDWALVHFSHHIGTAGSAAYETSAVARELMAAYEIAARWGEEPPHVLVRSHRHTRCKVAFPSINGDIIGEVTPSWQLKTPFAYKVAGARQAIPQIGGIQIHAGDRVVYTQAWIRSLERTREETA